MQKPVRRQARRYIVKAKKLFPGLQWKFWSGSFLGWTFKLETFSRVTMEHQTFSEVTVEYSEVLKALFRPFKLDSIPELRWNSQRNQDEQGMSFSLHLSSHSKDL